MGRWIKISLLSIALLFMMTGCGEENVGTDEVEIKEVALTKPQKTTVLKGNLRVTTSYDARMGPKVEQLTFAEAGKFGAFKVRLGDEVKKGDILAVAATEELEASIRTNEETQKNLTLNYEYEKASLLNQIKIAKLELENVYYQLEMLEYGTEEYTAMCIQAGNYDEQRKRLELQLIQLTEMYESEKSQLEKQAGNMRKKRDKNVIRAPFDGMVVALAEQNREVNAEELKFSYVLNEQPVLPISYGTPIDPNRYYVAVADPTVLYARCEDFGAGVLERAKKAVFWKNGKEYDVTHIPQGEDYYKTVNNGGEKAYAQFTVKDEKGEVISGDYGKIRLIQEEKENVLLLSETALKSSGGAWYVFKDVEGEQQRVTVKIGISDGIHVEILEGVEEGDVVYVQD